MDNLKEKLNIISLAQDRLSTAVSRMDPERFKLPSREGGLSQQVRELEEASNDIKEVLEVVDEAYNSINSILNYDIGEYVRNELEVVRQRYLEQETDTAREAAELLDEYLENPDPRLLRAALGWVKSQVPPTEEVYETIEYETAIIEDPEMYVGEEVVETEGEDGELKIVYEVTIQDGEEVRTEILRKITKEPVRKVIRVGTKELETEEPIEPENPENPAEPVEPENPEEPIE